MVALALVAALGVFKSGGATPSAHLTAASSGPLTQTAFRQRFAAVCAQITHSNSTLGTPTSTSLVPWTERLVSVNEHGLAALRALSPPASVVPGYNAYLAGVGVLVDITQQMEAAAKANNLTAFDRALAKLSHPDGAEQADERAAARYNLNCEAAASHSNAEDAAAKELAHTAQVAMETYSTDNNGSYARATRKVLHEYESTIQIVPGDGNAYVSAVRILAGGRGYVITTTSVTHDTFSMTRKPSGILANSCTTAAGNQPAPTGCPSSHTW